ncbi:MAG: TonB-dependent receptor, partial [Myxococcota bacterium]|nr:TonB-dependent receptor [Myxococcota bacterium]
RHRGTAGVRLILPLGFEASVQGRYVGSRPLANDLGTAREELPKFATYDARIAWTGALTDWLSVTLEGNAYNLTNREYTEFGGQSSFFPFPLGFFPSPERHYVAGVRLTVGR